MLEGLLALVPPVAVTEPFSPELQQWLVEKIIAFHKKALLWREKYNKWTNLEILKDFQKPKTAAEIAQERWLPKKRSIDLKFPDFD